MRECILSQTTFILMTASLYAYFAQTALMVSLKPLTNSKTPPNPIRILDNMGDNMNTAEQSAVYAQEIMRLEKLNAELVSALNDLRKELRAHIKFNVRKHYSLMVADAIAGTAIHNTLPPVSS